MKAPTIALLMLLFFGTTSVGALREQLHVEVSNNETQEDSGPSVDCTDYCVMCDDGSTVWYGRSRSWFRAIVNVFTEGVIMLPVGVINMFSKVSNEEFTSWLGYLPTTGLFCEKVDVLKFPASGEWNAFSPLMLYSRSWFGKMEHNYLKPYGSDGYHALKDWAVEEDLEAYLKGCKKMKGSGLKGKLSQLASNFEDSTCKNSVTKGAFRCSEHSRLCGKHGIHAMVPAPSYEACRDMKGQLQQPGWCPVPKNI